MLPPSQDVQQRASSYVSFHDSLGKQGHYLPLWLGSS